MNIFIASCALVFLASSSFAQTEYNFFVKFHDKILNYVHLADSQMYLSARSLERRATQGLEVDSTDLPVSQSYVNNILDSGATLRFVSKWLNGAVISVRDVNLAYRLKIKFYVDDVVYLGKTEFSATSPNDGGSQNHRGVNKDFDFLASATVNEVREFYNQSYNQLNMLNGIQLHQAGFRGDDMWVAVFDAGFYRVNELSAFRELINGNRLIATYDIITGGSSVYEDNDHGMNVLGVMAAISPKKIMGSAPEASYVLFRTESKSFENLLEELNWVRAAEMADSMGVDVINSSLGYNTFDEKELDHEHSELDGKTSYVSRGAAIAASRGMLIVNASGNDGNKTWKKINFPADAKGILTVGAVDMSFNPPSFSSFGPTADYRIKPEVSALGYQTSITTTYGVGKANGTSFSCPIVAGMMTCLWQMDRSKTPTELISIISRCGHQYQEPDNVLGYGIPNFHLAMTLLGKNKMFNYKLTQPVYSLPDTIMAGKWIDFHIAGKDSIYYELTENKRFIFIPYRSKLNTQRLHVPDDGFVKLPTSHHKKGLKKKVILSIYAVPDRRKKRGQKLYSTERVLIKIKK